MSDNHIPREKDHTVTVMNCESMNKNYTALYWSIGFLVLIAITIIIMTFKKNK